MRIIWVSDYIQHFGKFNLPMEPIKNNIQFIYFCSGFSLILTFFFCLAEEKFIIFKAYKFLI